MFHTAFAHGVATVLFFRNVRAALFRLAHHRALVIGVALVLAVALLAVVALGILVVVWTQLVLAGVAVLRKMVSVLFRSELSAPVAVLSKLVVILVVAPSTASSSTPASTPSASTAPASTPTPKGGAVSGRHGVVFVVVQALAIAC